VTACRTDLLPPSRPHAVRLCLNLQRTPRLRATRPGAAPARLLLAAQVAAPVDAGAEPRDGLPTRVTRTRKSAGQEARLGIRPRGNRQGRTGVHLEIQLHDGCDLVVFLVVVVVVVVVVFLVVGVVGGDDVDQGCRRTTAKRGGFLSCSLCLVERCFNPNGPYDYEFE
jgi:hypothetical protein